MSQMFGVSRCSGPVGPLRPDCGPPSWGVRVLSKLLADADRACSDLRTKDRAFSAVLAREMTMKHIATFALLVGLLAAAAADQTTAQGPVPQFQDLFNGKDLKGWVNINTARGHMEVPRRHADLLRPST